MVSTSMGDNTIIHASTTVSNDTDDRIVGLRNADEGETTLCAKFAKDGFCNQVLQCKYSHSVKLLLDQEESIRRKKKKRKASEMMDAKCVNMDAEDKGVAHTAGYDSFQTAYVFLSMLSIKGLDKVTQVMNVFILSIILHLQLPHRVLYSLAM